MRRKPSPQQEVQWLQECARNRYRPPAQGRPIHLAIGNMLSRREWLAEHERRQLRQAWLETAGPELAAESVPTKIERRALVVIAADAAICQEIALRHDELVSELQKRLPDHPFRRLRVRVGPVGDD